MLVFLFCCFSICSLILIQKILKIIEKEEKSLTKKVECYITAAKILTNTNNENCLNYVKNLLKNINSFIDVFGQVNKYVYYYIILNFLLLIFNNRIL